MHSTIFIEHLLCASSPSPVSILGFLHAAWKVWVCFHKTSSPLHHRLGLGHLLDLNGGLTILPWLAAAPSSLVS